MNENRKVPLRHLFVSFLKIGGMLFGGGYAMLPLLEREVVGRRGWCTLAEMTDYYAMAQIIPGVIAINTSMLIGQRLRGAAGTAAAMAGTVFFPFLAILAYAIAFNQMAELPVLHHAMSGLRPAAAGMLLGVACKLYVRTSKRPAPPSPQPPNHPTTEPPNHRTTHPPTLDRLGIVLPLVVFALVVVGGMNAIHVIVSGIAAGLAWWGWFQLRKRKVKR